MSSIIKDKELGPYNKEAGDLMMAVHNTVNSKSLKTYKDEDGDEDCVAGVGKDIFGKYGFAEVEFKGKVYLVQVRDKDQIDNAYKHTKIGIQMPTEKRELN